MLFWFRGLEILESPTFYRCCRLGNISRHRFISSSTAIVLHSVLVECFETIEEHLGHLFILLVLLLLFVILFLLDCLTGYLELLFSCFLSFNVSRPDVKVPFVLLDGVMPEELLEMLFHF
jgi:hypothetical protein